MILIARFFLFEKASTQNFFLHQPVISKYSYLIIIERYIIYLSLTNGQYLHVPSKQYVYLHIVGVYTMLDYVACIL